MISRVHGILLRRDIGTIEVLTEGGVAYELDIPLSVFEKLPAEGTRVELRTYQVIREDSNTLYGFTDHSERSIFARLLTASGVGPKLALAIVSAMPPERIVRAIVEKDVAALRQIPGLGTKKAERLVLELGDRLDDVAVVASGTKGKGPAAEQAVGALIALGYSQSEAAAAVRKTLDDRGALEGVDLIRASLASLGPRK